jgi:hypothetical protein
LSLFVSALPTRFLEDAHQTIERLNRRDASSESRMRAAWAAHWQMRFKRHVRRDSGAAHAMRSPTDARGIQQDRKAIILHHAALQ